MNTLITIRKTLYLVAILLLIHGFASCTTIPKLKTSDPIPEGYVRGTLISREGKLHTFITDTGDTIRHPSQHKWLIGNCYYVKK